MALTSQLFAAMRANRRAHVSVLALACQGGRPSTGHGNFDTSYESCIWYATQSNMTEPSFFIGFSGHAVYGNTIEWKRVRSARSE